MFFLANFINLLLAFLRSAIADLSVILRTNEDYNNKQHN